MIDQVLNTTLIKDSLSATLPSTRKLNKGMFLYNSNVHIYTEINSIDSITTLTMSKTAIADYVGNIIYSDLNPYRYAERCAALIDVQNIVKYEGVLFEYILRDEDQVTRDDYNSIIKKTQNTKLLMHAFPVQWNPSKEQLEKVGLREKMDIMMYTAMKDWMDNGYNYEDIEIIRSTVHLNGVSYKIADKTLSGFMGNTGIYVILGLTKG